MFLCISQVACVTAGAAGCWQALDVFLAGDDVPVKKPDPTIYRMAAEQLGIDPADCLVVEDSAIGCQVRSEALVNGPRSKPCAPPHRAMMSHAPFFIAADSDAGSPWPVAWSSISVFNIFLRRVQAATGAGMRCLITWTLNTKSAKFEGAERIVETVDGTPGVSGPISLRDLMEAPAQPLDDRLLMSTVQA